MFGGYPSFRRIPSAMRATKWLAPVFPSRRSAASAMSDWRARKWQHFAGTPDVVSAYRAVRGHFMPEEWPALIGPAFDDDAGRAAFETLEAVEARMFSAAEGETPMATVARMETSGYLQGQLLRDIDVVSMAHGLEVRVPFVDHRLLAAVWPAAGHHPQRAGRQAPAARKPRAAAAAGRRRPPEAGIHAAVRRSGCAAGCATSRRQGLQSAVSRGWVNARAAADVWSDWERGRAHWSRAWGLSVLGQFLQEAA